MTPLLTVRQLTKRFDGFVALDGLDLDVEAGDIHAIIGPNGAGKTTLFNLITGIMRPTRGEVVLAGTPLDGLPPERRTRLGLCRTFQNVRLFACLTAHENVMLAAQCWVRKGLLAGLLPWGTLARREATLRRRAEEALERVGLRDRAAIPAGSLSFGEQRLLEIARALAPGPRALLLDEPSAGMTGAEKERLAGLIGALNRDGITILLVEHDMRVVMGISHRITVLNFGRKIAEGEPGAVRRDPQVIEAYLGTG